jgi:hypothetical protein
MREEEGNYPGVKPRSIRNIIITEYTYHLKETVDTLTIDVDKPD